MAVLSKKTNGGVNGRDAGNRVRITTCYDWRDFIGLRHKNNTKQHGYGFVPTIRNTALAFSNS